MTVGEAGTTELTTAPPCRPLAKVNIVIVIYAWRLIYSTEFRKFQKNQCIKYQQILYRYGLWTTQNQYLLSCSGGGKESQSLAVFASVFLSVRRMDLDPGCGAWTQTSRSTRSTCDPVGSSSVLGLECDVGPATPLNSLLGMMGIRWKTVREWLKKTNKKKNKQWKQQREEKPDQTAGPWPFFFLVFLNSRAGSSRLLKVTAGKTERKFQRLRWKVKGLMVTGWFWNLKMPFSKKNKEKRANLWACFLLSYMRKI